MFLRVRIQILHRLFQSLPGGMLQTRNAAGRQLLVFRAIRLIPVEDIAQHQFHETDGLVSAESSSSNAAKSTCMSPTSFLVAIMGSF